MECYVLSDEERELLFRQERDTAEDGGWQGLLVKLQGQFDENTMELQLDKTDLERIPRYAFDYWKGGWEERLRGVFERHLGPRLGRARDS